jgi:hypothetical protein
VREADGDEQLRVFFGVEVDAFPLGKSRRVGSNVDHHVEDAARPDAQELRLPGTRLVVKPTQCSPNRAGLVVLHEADVDAGRAVARL